ncbi:MAG: VIT1/CCC1 family protein [Acidobacteria bacterium]|nr:VIT1/CCC1 family protein [Acidobacteriota bacterium]
MTDINKTAQYVANWQDERNGAALYSAISEVEQNPQLKSVYQRLAEAEERHSCFWEAKLRAGRQPLPPFRLNWRTRTLIFLARRFGPAFLLPNIEPLEQIDSHKYDLQPEAQAGGLPQQEQSHARLLRAITGGSRAGLEGSRIAQLEGRHRAIGGNVLRAAVLGANDGLLSNFSLVMGVAGANLNAKSVLITGVAGLLAGACSMALGEWLSVQSARELYERQMRVEKQEVIEVPEEEAEELALIYQAKGLPEDEARSLAERIITDETATLDAMAREELGINPEEMGGSAWTAAGASFCLFALGAIIPVAPFFILSGTWGVAASAALSALALFGIGAGITLLTGRGVLYSGLRQVFFGLLAAGITFGLGRVIGTTF